MIKTGYSKLNLFIRSSLFSFCSITLIVCYSFIILFVWLLPIEERHRLIRGFIGLYMWLLKKICHIDYEVQGLEHIPKKQTGVVLSKHQSTWETFFLPTLFHNPAVIAKRELLWIPFFGWGLAASDPIAINRNDKRSAMQQIIDKGKRCLNAGRWILMFPEGTRTAIGVIGKYKLGGARLAVATQHPVIPVAHDAGRYWPRRKFIKRPGTIHVMIGPMIETKGRTPEEVLELAKNWIEGAMQRIERLVNKPTD